MLAEVRLLQTLKGQVSLPIPDPAYICLSPEADRVVFMGYERLSGEPMTSNTLEGQPEAVLKPLAKQLADFLRELHTVPLASLESNLPVDGTRAGWLSLFEAIREKLYPYMRSEARAEVTANFEMALNDSALWEFEPVLCHGDFGTGNILCDPVSCRATGIVDFSLCGPGDPAQDVGAVWSLGDDFMPYFLDYYAEMRATLPRVEFIRSTYALQVALHGLQVGDQAEFEDGLGKYRAK
jgi:aminoglycoside 2''-phosphotransferase